jgi:signal transduction histidine kinase
MFTLSASDKQKVLDNVPEVGHTLGELLPTINPLLESAALTSEIHQWVEAFVLLVLTNPSDQTGAIKLGQQLELLDSFQPVDLLLVQDTLHRSLMQNLPEELKLTIYPALLSILTAVTGGFYIGKARRAASFDMSAASRMGHDLKTPINAITGFSHIILKEIDGPITPYQKEDLTSIYEAGKKLLLMINDLSSAMKQDASRFGLYPDKFLVSDLLSEVLANIQPLCATAGHTLNVKLERDLGRIEGDASKIRWIILSLLLYLSRQDEDWHLFMSVSRQVISDRDMLVFKIEGFQPGTVAISAANRKQVSSTEMLNRDVSLATCWRFCTSIGAPLFMFEDPGILFDLQIPALQIPDDNE